MRFRRAREKFEPVSTGALLESPWLTAPSDPAPEPAPRARPDASSPDDSRQERRATPLPPPDHVDASPVDDLRRSEPVLRRRVEELEAELQRYRDQERELVTARFEARQAAASIRHEAKLEAQATLRKARARANQLVQDAAAERERLEREIARRRALVEENGQGLLELLQQGLERLRTVSSGEPVEFAELSDHGRQAGRPDA